MGIRTRGYGIEAKSSKQDKLYWSKNFRDGQIQGLIEFCYNTGRTPLVAIEHRRGTGRPKKAYLMHAQLLQELKANGEKGVQLGDAILEDDRAIQLPRENQEYLIPENWKRF